jgi:hypothetical protein
MTVRIPGDVMKMFNDSKIIPLKRRVPPLVE